MRLLSIILLTSIRLGFTVAGKCKDPPTSCALVTSNAASIASCSSFISSKNLQTSSCSVIVTAAAPTSTKWVTAMVKQTTTLLSTSTRIISKKGAGTDTVIYLTNTITNTITTTNIDVQYETITYYEVVATESTTVTATETSYEDESIWWRLAKRQNLPSDCSCLFTSTVTITTTPKASIITTTSLSTSTVQKISQIKETVTSFYGGATATSIITAYALESATEQSESWFTVTTTISTTSTDISTTWTIVTALPTPGKTCNNAGISFAVYNIEIGRYDDVWSNFYPEIIKTAQSVKNFFNTPGVTDQIGFTIDNPWSGYFVYNQFYLDKTSMIVNHKFYFLAQYDGEYTFSSSSVDDGVWFWIGPNAYSGWGRANPAWFQVPGARIGAQVDYKKILEKGKMYPIRIVWGNSAGYGYLDFSITDPTGVKVMEPGKASTLVVQYDCIGFYPSFPPFGSET
ncbi:hypothetical protein H072_5093 [Dactylellina haptotyla CBS 200.50]|uniref:PA14 domain-containing protein n=1 Tax=Dactylellina haptotyla (strain CBS 200.50) TaxID=1284197 RepID=S8ADJ9_DACHA|nr:hypothetical protein H072_5093 [Dactylellina haptotyla CBS 200.50]